MKRTDADYQDAVQAAVDILRERARQARDISYGDLSAELTARGFTGVTPHHGIMSYLLKDVCLYDNEDGRAPMLSVLVVNKASRVPSEQFSVLARGLPFSRPGDWTWQDEQRAVFAGSRD
ncbi:hypothetical protein [Streptomyces ochraceiscleroticus]|uniref:Uncharacterized protein n=1 Tax=Streptomyces ochraceiscleroticus TaxID=47761 RepID=A0ABW1MVL4_9ACTN|nr:hypothetical protein [Streptomyces ochraceiscleroticus]